MKNLLQKALAGWLSVVTVFGASVPALASGGGKIDSGSVNGKVFSFEGPMPSNVVEIEMPTKRAGMFDFIIDPSGAIRATNGERYKDAYGSDVTFDSGKLFFQNYSTDENGNAHISYSNRSDSLVVTNKGNVPLDVEMTLEMDKGGYDFDFAAAPDFTDAQGVEIPGASMYMALVSEKREDVVKPVTVEEEGGGTSTKYRATVTSWLAPPEDAYRIVWADDAYRYQLRDDLPDSVFDRTSFYVTGALGEGVWDGAKEEIVMNIAWTVVPRESGSTGNPNTVPESSPRLQSVTYAYRDGESAKVMVDFGSGEEAMTTISGIRYSMEDGTTGFVSADAMTISPYPSNEYQSLLELPVSGDLFDAVEWAVVLSNDADETVDLPLQLVLDIMRPTATVLDRATTIGGRSEIRVHWGIMNAIAGITYTTSRGDSAEIPASAVEIDGEMSDDNTAYVTLDETAAKGTDFVLTMTNDEGDTAQFPLDLSNYTVEPTVEVAEKASASAPAAAINVDWGFGSKGMSSVSKVTYTTPSGDPAEIGPSGITTDGNTITVHFDETSIKGSNYALVLTNAKGATFTANVDLVESADPTATVIQSAEESNRYLAVMAVDWGTGSGAMNTVTKVECSEGYAATITDITVNGDRVSVQLSADALKARKFVATLANGRGETAELDVDFLVEPKDPTLTVANQASAVGEFATITVDWGAGSKSMSNVSEVTYLNASNTRVTLESSNYTVIGNTISIRLDEESVKGTDFKVTLENYDHVPGSPIALDKDLVLAADPTAIVTGKATNAGDSATITVNWGSGSKAMSRVSKVAYTDASGAAKEISGSSNITVDSDTVSVKFNASSIAGTDFKLVLTNASGATYETAVDLVNATDPTATVTTQASASGGTATITVNWGSGSKAMSSAQKVTYTDISGAAAEITGSTNVTTSGATVSVKFDANSIRGTNFKLVLTNASGATYETAVDLVDATDPTATVSRKGSATVNAATVTVNWGAGTSAMSSVKQVTYTNVLNKSATISASDITVSGNTLTVPLDEDAIKGTDFKLILTKPGGATSTLDVDLVTATNPSATVTSKATAAGESSSVTVNWGTGSSAMSSVQQVTYTTVSGTAAQISKSNFTTSGNTLSVKFDATSIKGSNFKLVLTKASGETYELALSLANYEESPSATVTKKATAPGQSSTITVSWGVGSRAMNSVQKVTYTNASGAAAEITTADITTSGATVSVKFDRNSIQGTDFKLILTNGKTTCTLPLDLAAFDPSAGLGADATVSNKAKTATQTATVTVDWGSGEQEMTSVKQVTYTKSGGGTGVILPGANLKTSGNTVSIKFTPITFKGTDFILVLTNGETDLEIPVDLIER